jgi:hypothetical protein
MTESRRRNSLARQGQPFLVTLSVFVDRFLSGEFWSLFIGTLPDHAEMLNAERTY